MTADTLRALELAAVALAVQAVAAASLAVTLLSVWAIRWGRRLMRTYSDD